MTEDDDAAVDLCTEESGLLCRIKRHHFFETGKFLVRVLCVLKPANAILQSQSVDMCSASEVVGAALESLKTFKKMSVGQSYLRRLLEMIHILQREGEQ